VNTWDVEQWLQEKKALGSLGTPGDEDDPLTPVYYSDTSIRKTPSLKDVEKPLGERIFGPAAKQQYDSRRLNYNDAFNMRVIGTEFATWVTKKPVVKKAKVVWQLPEN